MRSTPTYSELEKLLAERTEELKKATADLSQMTKECSYNEELMGFQRDLAISLSTTYDLNEGLQLSLEAGIKVSGMDCGGIYLFDEASGDLDLVVHKGLTEKFIQSVSHYDRDSENAKYAKKGTTLYTLRKDVNVPIRPIERLEGVKSFITLPLLGEEDVIGCMNLGAHDDRQTSLNARIAIETLATQIGSAISRLKYRAELRKSEERYRQIFNIAPAGIYEVDFRTRKIVDANDAICEYSGYTKDELFSLNPADLLTEESQKKFLTRINKMLNGESVPDNVDYETIKKDGGIIWLNISNRYIYDGDNVIGATVVACDITQRKQAEAELDRQSQDLEMANTALNVLLEKRQRDKADLEDRIARNIDRLVLPYVDKIESGILDAKKKVLIDIIRENLSEVTSSFSRNLSPKYLSLSPVEIQVIDLIKNGKSTKEMASILNISSKTAKNHRQSIRKKLGLLNRKTNLQSYLSSLN